MDNLPKISFPYYPFQDLNYNLISNNSATTSDDSEERTTTLVDERKHRRMISNRESARRSRMRKQRQLDELWSQVIHLRNENHNLTEKLNNISESHGRTLGENSKLKDEAYELKEIISSMQLVDAFIDFEDDIHSQSSS